MAAYNKFESFVGELGKGTHKLHAAGDTLKVMATNTAPAAANDVKADLTEITAQNGYPTGGTDVQNDYTEAGGTGTLTGVDVVWTGTGAGPAAFGPLRYISLYNDTPTSPADPLIGWWDYGSSITVNTGETFTVDFGASIFTIA